jgi:hypothetical protein
MNGFAVTLDKKPGLTRWVFYAFFETGYFPARAMQR